MNRKTPWIVAGLAIFSIALATGFGCIKTSPRPWHGMDSTATKTDTITIHDTICSCSDSCVDLKKGLLVYLPFAGNIVDSSGNNNPTTAVGSVLTTDRNGYTNNAFGTTGLGEEVLVTNNGSIKFDTAYTLSLVFMVNSYSSQTFVSFVDPATGNGPSFNIGMGTTTPGTAHYLDLGLSDTTSGCGASGANDPNKILETTSFIPQLNVWYNAIYIYHKGTINIYVNGTLIATKTGSGSKANLCPASKFIVGAWWNGDKQGIAGKLDNIRLYNRVITPKEITTLSQNYLVNANSVKPGIRTN